MFHKVTPDQWYSVINTNLNSLFNMCRPVIEGMRERGFGRIINISSVNGQKGQMGQTNYSASKAGDIGFTKALALENANKGITVNAIARAISRPRWSRPCGKRSSTIRILPQIPARKAWRTRGGCALRRVPCVRRRRLHHRFDPFGQRRPADELRGVPSEADTLRTGFLCKLRRCGLK